MFTARMLWIQPQQRGARGGGVELLPIADRPRVGPQRVSGVVVQICGGVDSTFSRLHQNAHSPSPSLRSAGPGGSLLNAGELRQSANLPFVRAWPTTCSTSTLSSSISRGLFAPSHLLGNACIFGFASRQRQPLRKTTRGLNVLSDFRFMPVSDGLQLRPITAVWSITGLPYRFSDGPLMIPLISPANGFVIGGSFFPSPFPLSCTGMRDVRGDYGARTPGLSPQFERQP
ncbi:hypothetical protein B0J12DRAFT_134053 [Macrophomina phaseolina]|uniref:Uncharacterized protein n=1 Tax=Macrophomina phaseolina TaxID=35725 RepID=A0ABQ8G6V4_9PEZI|nr:hypothetical protein B0J12DRAFT_134053 [Macrophomina phaseolina]